MKIAYKTDLGTFYHGEIEEFLLSSDCKKINGKVNLIFTSPPFPLNRKKKYGNLQGKEYLKWLGKLGRSLKNILADDGSIVIEIGNSWIPKKPLMSTLPIEALLEFLNSGNYHLCQQFIWNNPAKLPSPAQWVNIERIRVKDAFTNIWWMSKSDSPKANNRNVLKEYSDSMKKLLKTKKYNSGKRPSEHDIGEESFLNNNEGAIPSNVITAANTRSNTPYQNYCKENNIELHPARMPKEIPEFFINFLTEPGDLVFDPFGGSNTTGYIAESLKRKWISVESVENYIRGSVGRFKDKSNVILQEEYISK